jgi:hypothetical protein
MHRLLSIRIAYGLLFVIILNYYTLLFLWPVNFIFIFFPFLFSGCIYFYIYLASQPRDWVNLYLSITFTLWAFLFIALALRDKYFSLFFAVIASSSGIVVSLTRKRQSMR